LMPASMEGSMAVVRAWTFFQATVRRLVRQKNVRFLAGQVCRKVRGTS